MTKSELFNFLSINFIILIMALFVAGNYTHSHEELHRTIFNEYGCENTKIHYNFFGVFGGTTSCLSNINNMTDEDYRDMNLLNMENEITGYNTMMLIEALFMSIFLLVNIYMIIKNREENK